MLVVRQHLEEGKTYLLDLNMVVVENGHGWVSIQGPVVVVKRLGLREDIVGVIVGIVLRVLQAIYIDQGGLQLVDGSRTLGLEGGDGFLLLDGWCHSG